MVLCVFCFITTKKNFDQRFRTSGLSPKSIAVFSSHREARSDAAIRGLLLTGRSRLDANCGNLESVGLSCGILVEPPPEAEVDRLQAGEPQLFASSCGH